MCVAVLGPVLTLGLIAAGVESLTPGEFTVFKAVYTGLLAGVIGPVVGVWALLPFDHARKTPVESEPNA